MGERREVTGFVLALPDRDPLWAAERASAIIGRYGGRVVAQTDDAVSAIFGVAEPDGRDTEVATRCVVTLRALEGSGIPGAASAASLAGIGRSRPRLRAARRSAARVSVGLHAARIHLGKDGEPTDDERLKSLLATARDYAFSQAGRCAVSTTAMRQVRGLFEILPLSEGVTSRTGSTGAVVHDVRDPKDTFGRFVGRKDELRALAEVLAAATKRQASVFTLRGH